MLFDFLKPRSLYDSNHKLIKNISLEQIRTIESKHGILTSVYYFHGGGMEGGSSRVELYRGENGTPLISTSDTTYHSSSAVVKEYTADESLFERLRKMIDDNNLTVWEDLPQSEEIALDAPSTSLTMIFDDSSVGGSKAESFRIDYDNEVPEGGYDILRAFSSELLSGINPGNLTDAYFEFDGERVDTGRNIKNTDEEIDRLFSGYWSTGSDERNLFLDIYGLEEELCFRKKSNGEYSDDIYRVNSIVHEPWSDADCGWYVSLKHDSDDTDWVIYAEGVSLILRKCDDSEIYRLER